ncbi:ankyrin repeat domain-containing protein [Paenibacillus koleovorans]|uniref:ankyrin repeat domain-containing protein n=1 Tax=Paenibacillus koleovorans TaxID=121608 RepID=UPI000FD9FE26|nr:ankyrin repeat domain-containing protein [Paenibacillus koleovorans]
MESQKADCCLTAKQELIEAIKANDFFTVEKIISGQPKLLHEPIPFADGGGPLSYAAQCNHVALVEWLVQAGAKDIQQAFSRACMKANRVVAEYLVKQGADPNALYADHATHYGPVILAVCEALHPEGLQMILELGADPGVLYKTSNGRINSPFGFLLGAYARQPSRKHHCLQILADAGCRFEDTPITAFHLGRIDLLENHLRNEPDLLFRRFKEQELYFPKRGFTQASVLAPIEGTTLLHLAIEYDEFEIAQWLIDQGADVNALSAPSMDGGAGHSPMFHAVLACMSPTDKRTQFLLDHGADPSIRATIRHPEGGWDERAGKVFEQVTALEYALQFQTAPGWCNRDSIKVLGNLS